VHVAEHLTAYWGQQGKLAVKGNRGLKKYKHGLPGRMQHVDEFFKGRTARSITTDLINEFIGEMQDDGYENGTINRTTALLKRAMNIAKRTASSRPCRTSRT
jgi:hypothetical protein